MVSDPEVARAVLLVRELFQEGTRPMPSWASNKQAGIKSRRSHRCGVDVWGLWSLAHWLVHTSAEAARFCVLAFVTAALCNKGVKEDPANTGTTY